MSGSDRWKRAQSVVWRMAPGYLALGTVEGDVLEVEGSGDEVWRHLERWVSTDELVARLTARHGVADEDLAAEVVALLGELRSAGYVEHNE